MSESDESAVAEGAVAVAEPVADAVAEQAPAVTGRVARAFICERGHRVDTLWSTPTVCQACVSRTGAICGLPLYPIAELPEQVQKALNPLKASKKSSKK